MTNTDAVVTLVTDVLVVGGGPAGTWAAIKAAQAARPGDPDIRRAERDWQRARLPREIRELVLEDQALRNDICWFAFSD